MKCNIKLNEEDRKRILFNYYFFKDGIMGPYLRIVAFIGLIIIGLIMLFLFEGTFYKAYGGFCLGFGIFFLIRPIVGMVFYPQAFEPIDYELETKDGQLFLNDGNVSSTLTIANLYKIEIRRGHLLIYLKKRQELWIPIERIPEAVREDLLEELGC